MALWCAACSRVDVDRVRVDFLRDHPGAKVEAVDVGEGDGATAYVYVRYRVGGDPNTRLEVRQYAFDDATKLWQYVRPVGP